MAKSSPSTWSDMNAFMKHAFYPLHMSDTKPYKNQKALTRAAESARANRVVTDVRTSLPEIYPSKYFGDLGASEVVKAGGSIKMPTKDQAINAAKSVLSFFSQNQASNTAQNTVDNPYSILPFNGSPSGSVAYPTSGSMPNTGYSSFQDIVDRNNAQSLAIMRENNKFNADQAQLQRDWQTQLASTAHQREVADLKAAGLNPVLSAGGSGAVTPSGATASNAAYSNVAGSEVVSALATLAATSISANASITAASTAANASMWNAVTSGEYSKDVAEINERSAKYGYDRSKYGAIFKLMETFLHEYKPGDHSYVDNLFG